MTSVGVELRAVVIVLAFLSLAAAPADSVDRADTVFFGMNLGAGVARVGQPGLSPELRPGLQYDAAFGLGLTRRWAVGVELSTWQPLNINGDPTHVHLFAWRVEHATSGPDGLIMAASLGMGLGDGSQTKRIGSGGTMELGHRWGVAPGVTVAAEVGVHGVVYTDGSAVAPFAALQLRFWGRRK